MLSYASTEIDQQNPTTARGKKRKAAYTKIERKEASRDHGNMT
jgi:hypothetical protein